MMRGAEIKFGRFRLDLEERKLSRDGAAIRLGNRALDLLCVLASAKGEVITKDDLMARVWGGRVVEENNIQVHISALRKALDLDGDGQSHVVTVPGRGYRLIDAQGPAPAGQAQAQPRPAPVGSDKPSIAVLPFQNMSSDPEQEHFTDGMVEDITTALSRASWLSVVARNSSFIYQGRSVDVKQVGRELGVRYVVEGSVRKVANRLRITVQLIDAVTGAHFWADRFDGDAAEVFELQDRVTASVVGALEPRLIQAEIERTKGKPAATPFECLAQGAASIYKWTNEANWEALRLFRQAIALDPDLAVAHGAASQCYTFAKSFGWLTDPAAQIAEGMRLAGRGLELGREDPLTLSMAGFAVAYLNGDLDRGAMAIDRAQALNPNLAGAWGLSGWIRVFLGEPALALEHLGRAVQLSPHDAMLYAWQTATATAHFCAGRYDDALAWAEQASRQQSAYLPAARILLASGSLAGRLDQLRSSAVRLRQLDPSLRLSNLQDQIPFRRAADLARYAEGLRQAGVPE